MMDGLTPNQVLAQFSGAKTLYLLVQGQWVQFSEDRWTCDCPKFVRSGSCEHVQEASLTFEDPDWRKSAASQPLQ